MATHPYTRLFPGKTTIPGGDEDSSAGYEVGDVWIRTNGEIYQCVDATVTAAFWPKIGALTAADIAFTPVGNLSSSTVKDALAELDTEKAPAAKGVTNGDSHDHNGGDGAQIAYSSLSGLPTAETNTNDIFTVLSPGGTSAFVGTIATLPGGASLTYNVTSGTEGAMVPASTSLLAKMRLYNTTRGTSALISNCNTGTNTITLTANVPAGWQVGDTIDIASQTVSGGGVSWVDLEITSGPTGKSSLFVNIQMRSATVGDTLRMHPFDASFSGSKYIAASALIASQNTNGFGLQKVTSNVFCLSWTGTPEAVVIREAGYLQ